jgi:diguanylate cyclase (GGDEF)-like protein
VSYRSRLSLFFTLIVIVPMAAVTILVIQLSGESRTGKADARLAGDLRTALVIYRDKQAANRLEAEAIARDRRLTAALRGGRAAEVKAQVDRIATARGLKELRLTFSGGSAEVSFENGVFVAPAILTLQDATSSLGSLTVSATDATMFLNEVRRLTGAAAMLSSGSTRLAATAAAQDAPPDVGGEGSSSSSTVDLPQGEQRARTVTLTPSQRLTLFEPISTGGLISSQPLLAAVLVAFFLLALMLILPLLRDLQQLHGVVEQEALTDELTGLSNQRRFRELIAKEVERARRFDRPLSLVMADIDDFKDVNDTYGHLQGDQVLREVAEMLRSESREIDEPARYGGEEFAIVLPETTIEGAVELAERVRMRLERTPITLPGDHGVVNVRASIGVAGTPETAADVTRLIADADKALYEAKRSGKNQTRSAA